MLLCGGRNRNALLPHIPYFMIQFLLKGLYRQMMEIYIYVHIFE
jgi:hypothetical protein